MSARLLIIGLDGADRASLERWSNEGILPNLAALRKAGVTRRLSAPEGTTDDSLWASFQYAAGEAEHGRYNYTIRLRSGAFGMAFHDEADRDAFWHRLSGKGQRVAVLDVPKTASPRAVNGVHLADWLVHGRYFMTPRSYPDGFAAEVLERFGPAPPSACSYHQPVLDDDRVRTITGNLRASVAKKRAAALHYLAAEPWDLFVVGFKEAHCAGHGLWNFADPRHPEFDQARGERLGWPVRSIIADIDAAVGDLVRAAGADAEVVVFTTTGMEPNGSLEHLLPNIVERLNQYLAADPGPRIRRVLDRIRGKKRVPFERRCEILPASDNAGALRLVFGSMNTRKRARTMRQIERLLSGLTDAETGEHVVAGFTHPAADRKGSRAESLPDLVVLYRSGRFPHAVVSPRLGRIEASFHRWRPGNHVMGGLAICAGRRAIAAAPSLRAMQDFGPMAAEVLGIAG